MGQNVEWEIMMNEKNFESNRYISLGRKRQFFLFFFILPTNYCKYCILKAGFYINIYCPVFSASLSYRSEIVKLAVAQIISEKLSC
jgi:hypothetical protein